MDRQTLRLIPSGGLFLSALILTLSLIGCARSPGQQSLFTYNPEELSSLPTVTPSKGRTFEEFVAYWQETGVQAYVFTIADVNADQIGDYTFRLPEGTPFSFTLQLVNLHRSKTNILFMVLVDSRPITATIAGLTTQSYLHPLPYATVISVPISIPPLPRGLHDVVIAGFVDPYKHEMEPDDRFNKVDDFIAYRVSLVAGGVDHPQTLTFTEPTPIPEVYQPLGPLITLSERGDAPYVWVTTTVTAEQPVSYYVFTSAMSSITPCDEFALLAFLDYKPVPINPELDFPFYVRVCDHRTIRIKGQIGPLEPGLYELTVMRVPNPGVPLMVIRGQPGADPFDYDPAVSERVLIIVQTGRREF